MPWRLTLRELATADARGQSQQQQDSDSEPRAVTVADLDTRAAASLLPNVKAGDDIELPLPDGSRARARVNLVVSDDGVLRLGGALPDKQGGSFSLALDARSQLSGRILLRDIELAYTITPGARPGTSRMEALALADVICYPFEAPYETPDKAPYESPPPPDIAQTSAATNSNNNSNNSNNNSNNSANNNPPPPEAITVPALSSRPNAPAVLYLEFNGADVTDPDWNNGITIHAAAANLTATQITQIWKGVAEAYSPFNIDVTTDTARYNSMPAGKRMRCIITPTYQWYTNSTNTNGVSYVGSFAQAGRNFASNIPCWVFVPAWYSYISLVAAHELGHTVGLRHDGLSSASPGGYQEYFGGHGSGPMSWGPIMGNPSYRNIVQWSKGEYAYASNTEDDIAIIAGAANGFGYYNDGNGKTRATATTVTLPASGDTVNQGVITTGTSEAWFTFTLASPETVYLSATPADTTPKLDIALQLQNAAGNVLISDNPSLALDALIETTLTAGTYYLKIQGASYNNGVYEGYTRYGSIGQYTLDFALGSAIAPPVITQQPQSTTAATDDAGFTLTAAASGGGRLSYQWQKDGVDLASDARHPDVTSPALTILSPTVSDAGQYTLTVRNAGGATTSNAATVTITAPPPPVIVTQPKSQTVTSDDYGFTLYVAATGAGTLRYQWQKDGVDLVSLSHYSGVTSAYLYVYDPDFSDSGNYTVKVSNAGGDTISNIAIITVTLPPPPVITTQPANVTSVAGSQPSIYLYVSATGSGFL